MKHGWFQGPFEGSTGRVRLFEENMGFVLLIRWTLLAMGLTYALTEAAIFAPLRLMVRYGWKNPWLTTLVYCRACTGFWVGLALGAFDVWPFVGTWSLESAVAAMALGAIWNAFAPNHAWENEAADDEAVESQDG